MQINDQWNGDLDKLKKMKTRPKVDDENASS